MRRFFLILCFLLSLKGAIVQTGNIVIPSGHANSIEKVVADNQGKYLYIAESAKGLIVHDVYHARIFC